MHKELFSPLCCEEKFPPSPFFPHAHACTTGCHEARKLWLGRGRILLILARSTGRLIDSACQIVKGWVDSGPDTLVRKHFKDGQQIRLY